MSQTDEHPLIADEVTVAELVARLEGDPAGLVDHAKTRGLAPPDDRPGWRIGEDFDERGEIRGLVWYYPLDVREPDRVPVAADEVLLERLWAYLDTHGTSGLTGYARQLGVDPPPGRSSWQVRVVQLDREPGPGLYWEEPGPPPSDG
jgi:hypothetical protein